jgi:hypothetical protein
MVMNWAPICSVFGLLIHDHLFLSDLLTAGDCAKFVLE